MAIQRQRKLAAIMFTDIVGYSTIMQRDESLGRDIRNRHKNIFDQCTAQHQGKVIQYYGDGTLSIFDSAVSAVECAVSLQQQLSQTPPVPLRIGIHLGDIHYDETEVFGHGVNVAARIEPVCNPGGIFISDKVYDEIKNHPWLKAKQLGSFSFKNINRPIGLYAIQNKGIIVPDAKAVEFVKELSAKDSLSSVAEKSEAIQRSINTERRQFNRKRSRWIGIAMIALLGLMALLRWQDIFAPVDSSEDDGISIAVLPFVNMSGTEENEYFSDGMTEDILTILSKIDGFKVTSRTSVMQYKDSNKGTRKIGRELAVGHILEGSVRRDGNQVRITAQLIDAKKDEHIWAETYNQEMTSIFEIQSQVASDIAHHLKKELSTEDQLVINNKPTKDVTSYDYYLKGRKHYRKYTAEDNEKAISLFKQALETDPDYSYAFAGLGDAYAQKAFRQNHDKNLLDTSVAMSKKAIQIDPNLSDGYKSLGLAYQYMGKMDSALEQYTKAIKCDPNNDMASNNIGSIYLQKGDIKEGTKWAHRTLKINKNLPSSVINLAKIYNEVGDLETSKMILDDGIDVHPEEINLRLMKGEVLLREGNYAEAREEVQKVIQSKPEMAAGYQFLGNVYMYENNWEKAKESFKKAKELPDEWSHPLKDAMLESLIAFADNKEGNKEEAELKWQQILEKIESEKVDDREMKLESCLYRSGIYAAMGKEQEAILCLEEATKKNWMDYKISSHPAFDNIKSNPDFEKLMKSIKSKADSLKMELESIHSQTSL